MDENHDSNAEDENAESKTGDENAKSETRDEPDDTRVRLLGMNHVALEVGDVDEAIEWYRDLFAFDLRGRSDSSAFLDMGDQFLALAERHDAEERFDDGRHVGLVVDDADALERRLVERGIERLDTSGIDVHDPWGNRLQIVDYREIQFTKVDHVLDGMGLETLEKTPDALDELAKKGLAPE